MSMTKEQLKDKVACVLCANTNYCDKKPTNTKRVAYGENCGYYLALAGKALKPVQQYIDENKIKQVVEGKLPEWFRFKWTGLPEWFRFKWTGLQPERAFTDDLKEISYVKVKPVRLVE